MNTIQPFMDLGFYTVPLSGELKRLSNGKKSIPKFEVGWRDKYTNLCNTKASALGGTITGSVSGIVAIDCDSDSTYELFKSLDTANEFHFISQGKPEGGGTILYEYIDSDDQLVNFSVQNDTIKLDFYADNGFVYLPTDSNETKVKWEQEELEDMPKLLPIPAVVDTLLKTLYTQYLLSKNTTATPIRTTQRANYLSPALVLMLDRDKFNPTLFRIITPKDFRSLPQYVKLGYLHPNNVPDGRGSEYLVKVSAILGRDTSVDRSLYERTIQFINTLWDDAIPQKRLLSTIIMPMLSGRSSVAGESIWSYDDAWQSRGFSFINKLSEAVEVFFDDVRSQHYLMNFTRDSLKTYIRESDLFNYIDTVGLGLPPKKEYQSLMPLVRTTNDPTKEFGFFAVDDYTRSFNTFNQTAELKVLTDPESYKLQYTRPDTIIQYFESLVPNKASRDYLLSFIKKKLTTFKYSPVVLYFLGKPGSGKDTFVNILAMILGEAYIGKPTTREFLEQYNGWIVDKYFIHLDEYGNQLSTFKDKQEALGKIKAYSGKENISVRQMRTDGFPYKHCATFVMTANSNPLLLEEDDRRAFILDTPNNLATEEWVLAAGGISDVQDAIREEVIDFCYYLATEIKVLSNDNYVLPPDSIHKHEIIAKSLPAGQKLAYYFKHKLFNSLHELMEDYCTTELLAHASEQRVNEEDLFYLYSQMTDNAGKKRGLTAAMADAGFSKIPTTKDGSKSYYYRIPQLMYLTVFSDISDQ